MTQSARVTAWQYLTSVYTNKLVASYLIQEQSFVHGCEGGCGTLMVGEFHECVRVISRL
jgi:hypothetical protein